MRNKQQPRYTKKNIITLLVLFIPLLLIGTWMIYKEHKQAQMSELLEQKGVFTEGIVTDYTHKHKGPNYTYYKFYVNNKLYEGKSQLYGWGICKMCNKLCKGTVCKVRYLTTDPTINELFTKKIDFKDTLLVNFDDCFLY